MTDKHETDSLLGCPIPGCGGHGIGCEWGGVRCSNRDTNDCLDYVDRHLWQGLPRCSGDGRAHVSCHGCSRDLSADHDTEVAAVKRERDLLGAVLDALDQGTAPVCSHFLPYTNQVDCPVCAAIVAYRYACGKDGLE